MPGSIASNGQSCAIKLQTRQQIENDLTEFRYEKMGHLVTVNGSHYIQFDVEDEQGESVKTTFKLAKDNTITIIREQLVKSRMRFNPSKSTSMRYHTPHGSILFDIHTKQIRLNYYQQPFSADLYIAYDLYTASQLLGQYDIQLNFTV